MDPPASLLLASGRPGSGKSPPKAIHKKHVPPLEVTDFFPADMLNRSPSKAQQVTIEHLHRTNFLQQAYDIKLESETIATAKELDEAIAKAVDGGKAVSSKRLTPAKYRRRAHALKHWDTGDTEFPNVREFRKAYSDCKNLRKKGWFVRTTPDNDDILWIRTEKHGERRLVHMLETFDIIREHHEAACHYKADTTKIKIDNSGYHNITREECAAFVETCPSCSKNLKSHAPPYAGAKKHIESNSFRSLFQIDLIDFREDCQVDAAGVRRNWLMVVKDHCTRFLAVRDLPTKASKHVAREFYWICSLIGYPLVLQADNGSEFAGELDSLLLEVKELDGNCVVMKHGQPRTPRHQGSVERANQDIKNGIAKMVADLRSRVDTPEEKQKINWLTVYPRFMAAHNSSIKSRRTLDKSPYYLAFGMSYRHNFYKGRENSRLEKHSTPEERAALLGPEFAEEMQRLGLLSEETKEEEPGEEEQKPHDFDLPSGGSYGADVDHRKIMKFIENCPVVPPWGN